jgi:hypothetical protein
MKRSIVAAISLLFVAGALLAEVSGERPVSDPAYGPPPGNRYGTAAASDGRDFLVAWVDTQRNRASFNQIYAARMNAAGDILDPLGIRMPALSNPMSQASVVFLGENYLVSWFEPSPVTSQTTALMGVRINRDGVLLDATPRLLADRAQPSVNGAASNGNRTVIVFGDSMVVLDHNANVIDGPRKISPDSTGAPNSMVASNGHDFLVLWQKVTTINSIRLDANGVAASSTVPVTTSPFSQAILDLASDGESYVSIIREGFSVVAQHVATTGEMLEKSTVPLGSIFPGFAFTGGSYLLMDSDFQQRSIGVRRLDRTGKPIGSYVGVAPGQSFGAGATLASNGTDAGFFWTEWVTSNPSFSSTQSFSATVVNGQSLAASKITPIISAAKTQTVPAAATSGRNNAVVWNEDDGLYAGRLSLDGKLLDGRGIRVGLRSTAEPRIVYDGANYLIGWIEADPATRLVTFVKVARMSPDTGMLLDPAGIIVATTMIASSVSLSTGSSATLIAWSESGQVSSLSRQVMANFVSRDGKLGLPVMLTPADGKNRGNVSSAWNGNAWLIVWEDLVPSPIIADPGGAFDTVISAALLSSSPIGSVCGTLPPSPSCGAPIPFTVSNTPQDSRPVVASNGDNFLIVWSHADPTLPFSSVFAQRVSAGGSLLAPAGGVRLAGGVAKSVVWDGLLYDVALSSHTPNGYPVPYDLFVTHVAASGSIESLNPLAVISNSIDPYASLLVTGIGRTTTVYTRVGTEPQYGDVERAFVSVPHLVRGRAVR